jgi:hypothetical protein
MLEADLGSQSVDTIKLNFRFRCGQERHGPQLPDCGALIQMLVGKQTGPMRSIFDQVFR